MWFLQNFVQLAAALTPLNPADLGLIELFFSYSANYMLHKLSYTANF